MDSVAEELVQNWDSQSLAKTSHVSVPDIGTKFFFLVASITHKLLATLHFISDFAIFEINSVSEVWMDGPKLGQSKPSQGCQRFST